MASAVRKKLIEVSIPLEAINVASAREKSIRHGHPSTLHLWWARRPLAACRAVLFAQLVDDPSAWPGRYPFPEVANTEDGERKRLHKIIERLVPWEASNDERILNEARWEIARSVAWGLGEEPPPRGDDAVGRSRWLGSGRPLSASIGRAIERVAAGDEPGCTLSRRASARLAEIRERLDFVDGSSMPVVRDASGRTTVWTFAGNRANAMLAHALRLCGTSVASADGLALVVRNADVGAVAAAIDRVDPAAARPEVPPGLAAELKFSECLPSEIVATVVEARLSDRAAFDEALRRPRRVITAG